MTSWRPTMLSCLSSFIRLISRIAVDGVPSSESRWISFRATVLPVVRSLPLNTVAYVLHSSALRYCPHSPFTQFFQLLVIHHLPPVPSAQSLGICNRADPFRTVESAHKTMGPVKFSEFSHSRK